MEKSSTATVDELSDAVQEFYRVSTHVEKPV